MYEGINGNIINLIADGTYDCGKLRCQVGINGRILGLITLDSMRYTVSEDVCYSRDDIIVEILK